MKLILSWFTKNDIWVTGFLRIGNRYIRNEEMVDYFQRVQTISDFKRKLISANGQFSVVIRRNDEIWAAVDRLRNYPLYYTLIDCEFAIGDDSYLVAGMLQDKYLNNEARSSFLSAGFTPNNLTLVDKVFQIEAGSYVVFGRSAKIAFYHDASDGNIVNQNIFEAGSALYKLINNVFSANLEALSDKFIVIPLSGGFDSRLIAAMCSKYHTGKILCYTYGSADNPEVQPAAEIAQRLGLKWINIVYNKELIKDFLIDGFFNDYYPYVSGLSSMFFMQEYFAVRYLKNSGLIPDDSVFMPGFSGDVIAGSHLIPVMKKKMNRKQITNIIFREYCRMIHLSVTDRTSLINLIAQRIPTECSNPWRVFETWDMKERQAKFIVNSAKVWRFFGFEYVIPLWDYNLVKFFSELPFEFKLYKKLYDMVLKETIFRDTGLNLKYEISATPTQIRVQRIKESVKPVFPRIFRNLLIDRRSPICYDEITKLLINDLGSDNFKNPVQLNYFNSYISQWYIFKTIKDLALSYKL
ncbi:MAG: hypothetical protein JXN62_05995 [Bacteroidales bacterium]|nr:hypothetical protein [Bacteroidales bacterium]